MFKRLFHPKTNIIKTSIIRCTCTKFLTRSFNSSLIKNVNEINKYELIKLSNWEQFDDHVPYILTCIKDLELPLLGYTIIQSHIFVEGFIKYLINNNDIKLLNQLTENREHKNNNNKNIIGSLFENSNRDTKLQLAKYLIDHIEDINSDIIFYSILCSYNFANMLTLYIMSDIKNIQWLNTKLNSVTFRSMLDKLTTRNSLLFFKFLLDNKEIINGEKLVDASEFDINFGDITFNELLSNYIIETRNFGILKEFDEYSW